MVTLAAIRNSSHAQEPRIRALPKDPTQRRVVLSGGGTAGHVYPALAVAEVYGEIAPRARLLFVGTRAGTESRLVAAHGHRFAAIPGAPLFGVGPTGKARALRELARSMVRARQLLAREGIQLVLGFGGYASAGTVLAARSLGLPCAIHEPNAVPGLTNRLLGRFATRVYVSHAAAGRALGRRDAVLTGTPVRAEIRNLALARDPAHPPPARVLVAGGSLGSDFLNRRVPEALAQLARSMPLEVRHQAGARPTAGVEDAYRASGMKAEVLPYLDDIAAAYRWADAAIVCAGAITLAELAAAALPALVVPLARASRDHQRFNARAFAEASGMPWMTEREWRDDVAAARLASLLRGEISTRRLQELARADAAGDLVRDCEALLPER